MVRVITGVGIMPFGLDKMDLFGLYLEMESEGLKSKSSVDLDLYTTT
jgi:hypothetical protein